MITALTTNEHDCLRLRYDGATICSLVPNHPDCFKRFKTFWAQSRLLPIDADRQRSVQIQADVATTLLRYATIHPNFGIRVESWGIGRPDRDIGTRGL